MLYCLYFWGIMMTAFCVNFILRNIKVYFTLWILFCKVTEWNSI